jgi:hypothetical protein
MADALRFHDVHHEPSVVIGKGWQLDDGDRGAMRWHDDAVHVVRVHGDLCAAIGKNAFGRFVAAGYLSGFSHQVSKDDAFAGYAMTRRKMTLARRYLADDDARARTWRIEDVMACVVDAERRAKADARAASHKPWMTEALGAKTMPAAASAQMLEEAGASRDGAGRVISAPMRALTPGKRKIVEREAETRVGYIRRSRFGE